MILMELKMSMGRGLISLVTLWVLTISYFWVSGGTSHRQALLPNGGGSRSHGLYRQSTVGEFGCSTVFCATGAKTQLRARFELTVCQTQQRWADQPTCPLRRKLIVTLCPLAIDPPSFLFHFSAHRYCAWSSSIFASPTPSRCLPSADLEAMKLIDGPVESRPAEFPAFRTACARHRDSSATDATSGLAKPVAVEEIHAALAPYHVEHACGTFRSRVRRLLWGATFSVILVAGYFQILLSEQILAGGKKQ